MKQTCVLSLCGVLLVAICSLSAQTPPTTPPNCPACPPPVPTEPLRAETIDDLLNKLDTIQNQEADLKKAKAETVALLKNKLEQLKQRLQRVGGGVEQGTLPTVGFGFWPSFVH